MKKTSCYLALALFMLPALQSAQASNQGIIVTVNDIPITTLDIQQRLSLLKILGERSTGPNPRKFALRMMVDEIIKIAEAKKYKMDATDKEVSSQIGRMAKSLKKK